MAEAVSLCKTIAEANRRYFLATGKYANHISDLDIEIPGELSDAIGTGQRVKTKYFSYTATDSDERPYLVIAQHLPEGTYYSLYITKTDTRIHCDLYTSTDKIKMKLCNAINETGAL